MIEKPILETLLLHKKRHCDTCNSQTCVVRRFCSTEWRVFLTKHKLTYLFPAGTEIFAKGDKVEGIYCVYSGYIKVYEFDKRSEKIVDLVKGGEILGYRGLGNNGSDYTVSAKALSECEVTFFPMDIFRLAIEANKDLAFYIIDLLAGKLKKMERRANTCTNIPAKEKVEYALRDVMESFGIDENDGNRLKFTIARKDIASLAGTTYETVIRVLTTLDKKKQIKLDGKSISVVDMAYFWGNQLND
ncbi:MAG: Crp/Fnr family transcriptional regulator [Bacteroidales bacterium]|nr:Crp/Fnr family transcriptional regulator [Bacteroidales bacterium]MCF8455915.1 Crp/Fnr family transcriptional regulator [Bacteroidales bacterium]